MTTYISCSETAKLIRKELKANFPDIKFSVKSKVYAGGASVSIGWTDGPACPSVEKIVRTFQGSTFDSSIDLKSYVSSTLNGEEVHFGADYVHCRRNMSRAYVEAIIVQFCKRWGKDASKIKIAGNDQDVWVDAYALGHSEEHWFNEILHGTDAKDMHRPYEAEEERERAEHEEWERNEPQRKAEQEREAAEYAKREEVRRQQEQAQAKARKEQERARQEQEARQQRERATRRAGIATREQALAYLGLTSAASETMIKTVFRMRVKNASDGKGGYTEDMDNLVKAKEKALRH